MKKTREEMGNKKCPFLGPNRYCILEDCVHFLLMHSEERQRGHGWVQYAKCSLWGSNEN